MHWNSPIKPAELTENRLIEAILEGHFPVNSHLPGERDLAEQLGVTRPTLREALQRLARDGWLEINQGKATRVRNYWTEGNLNVLATLVQFKNHLPENFVSDLLTVRRLLAPAYARLAVETHPQEICDLLTGLAKIPDTAEDFTTADWSLHQQLTILSGNPIFTLILNGFAELYIVMGHRYFAQPAGRKHSRQFYRDLLECARRKDGVGAETLVQKIMTESITLWQQC
ncbi:MAG: fatty acid metabolism transcriptional regulator FadR [Anaerolineaceae bacterium]|jgi:GntR family negative regulator for fad regulon and positive regulator of fabA|nr:fatty acid metabolism transcriptional regulator FadR [Anaerolineaceae bacterium]